MPCWSGYSMGNKETMSVGLIALPYYRDSHPVFAATARRAIEEVLADG